MGKEKNMQKIKVECHVGVDMYERVVEALITLSKLNATVQRGDTTTFFAPIECFNLSKDGKLSMTVQGLEV